MKVSEMNKEQIKARKAELLVDLAKVETVNGSGDAHVEEWTKTWTEPTTIRSALRKPVVESEVES